MLLRDNIGMDLKVVLQTFFLLCVNLGLFVGCKSNAVVEMVDGVESIGDSVVTDVEE